jgi:cell division initiation protein
MSLEFKNKTFPKVLRGYSPEEVENYLDYIDEEYKELERTSKQNEKRLVIALKKLDETSRRLAELSSEAQKREANEKSIIAEAEYTAKRICAEAKLKAARIIKQATDTAENIMRQNELDLAEAKAREENVYKSAQNIYGEICKFKDTLFDLYRVHLDAIEVLSNDAKELITGVEDVRIDIDDDDYSDIDLGGDYGDEIVEESAPAVENTVEEAADVGGTFEVAETEIVPEEDLSVEEYVEEYNEELASDDFFEVEESDDFEYDGDGFETVDGEEIYYEEDAPEDYAPMEATNADLDDFFMDDTSADMSLTDEFEIIFSNNNSSRNVDEIRRQPTVSADETPKHNWFKRN